MPLLVRVVLKTPAKAAVPASEPTTITAQAAIRRRKNTARRPGSLI